MIYITNVRHYGGVTRSSFWFRISSFNYMACFPATASLRGADILRLFSASRSQKLGHNKRISLDAGAPILLGLGTSTIGKVQPVCCTLTGGVSGALGSGYSEKRTRHRSMRSSDAGILCETLRLCCGYDGGSLNLRLRETWHVISRPVKIIFLAHCIARNVPCSTTASTTEW